MLTARGLTLAPPGAASPVLRDLSLEISRGEWLAVCGSNGSGKTTLALAIAGLLPVRGGYIALDGVSYTPAVPSEVRSRISAVLQEPSSQLLASTVAEELGFAARQLGWPRSRIDEAVSDWSKRLELTEDLAAEPSTLSAGRQQLVLLGAALITRPRLLVLDEAGAHLDAGARQRVVRVLRQYAEEGAAILWATQEHEEIEAADRVLDLDRSASPPVRGQDAGDDRQESVELGPAWIANPHPNRDGPHVPMLRIAVSRWDGTPGPRVAGEGDWALEIAGGEITALEGPNGSGKSVFLSAIAGLEPCGQITTQWAPTPRIPPVLAAQYPELQTFAERVREEVVFGAVRRGLSVDRALALALGHLEALDLGGGDFLSRRCWDLSTGERRLVQVVGALVSPASLVLLDEPTAGIDPARRRALASLVVGRLGLSPVLVASQDADWLDQVGARRWRIGRSGPKAQVPAKKRIDRTLSLGLGFLLAG